jgi:hypothetical protein
MKEKILQALKTKFSGVNASILDRIADSLSKTVTTDEEVTTAVEGVTKDYIDIIEQYGDSRANDATRTAIRNYEKQHNLKNGEKVDTGDDTKNKQTQQDGSDNVPSWAQQLIDANKSLTERLNKMDTERTTNERKAQLTKVVSKLPANLRKAYDRISVDTMTDEEFSTLVSDVKTEVDGMVQDINSKGAVFGKPSSHNKGANQGDELTKAQKDAIAQRSGQTSEDGQPF